MRSFLLGAKTEVKPALPYDAEVEYLESTGTQWIDTGITPDSSSSVKIDATITTAGTGGIFGSGGQFNSPDAFMVGTYVKTVRLYIRSANNLGGISIADGDRVHVELSSTSYTIRNETTGASSSATPSVAVWYGSSLSMYVFSCNTSNSEISKKTSIRLHSVSYNDDVTRLDLIPVRVGQVGYMYDRVSGQLFGNSGTGEFIIGPDKEVA